MFMVFLRSVGLRCPYTPYSVRPGLHAVVLLCTVQASAFEIRPITRYEEVTVDRRRAHFRISINLSIMSKFRF